MILLLTFFFFVPPFFRYSGAVGNGRFVRIDDGIDDGIAEGDKKAACAKMQLLNPTQNIDDAIKAAAPNDLIISLIEEVCL